VDNFVRIAFYTSFPPAISPFHSFDPDSWVCASACYDTLVVLGIDGQLIPLLATDYRAITPLCMEFELRQGVHFHNGLEFTAQDVFATFNAHISDGRTFIGKSILESIKEVEIVDTYRVRFHTFFPDPMMIWRMSLFSCIAPAKVLEEKGVDYFKTHPIGTGPYIFEAAIDGRELRYRANPNYWAWKVQNKGIRFIVIPSQYWLKSIINDQIDLAYGISDELLPFCVDNPDLKVTSRLCNVTEWFILATKGPLLDKRVRQALNFAIDNPTIANVLSYGSALPQKSLGSEGEFGYNPSLKGYPYDKEKALELMAEAGYGDGFELKGIVTDRSALLVQMIAVYLNEINIKLSYEILPRSEWSKRVINPKMSGTERYGGDFAVFAVDSPIMHVGFPHFSYLSERGISLGNYREYQERFVDAMTASDLEEHRKKIMALDEYALEEALMLFTIQTSVHAVCRPGIGISISKTGYFGTYTLGTIVDDRPDKVHPEYNHTPFIDCPPTIKASEFSKLLSATADQTVFWLPEDEKTGDLRIEALSENLKLLEEIKNYQSQFRLTQLVEYINRSRDLNGIFGNSSFIGIATYNIKEELILYNRTYVSLLGDTVKKKRLSDLFALESEWLDFKTKILSEAGYFGSLDFKRQSGDILNVQISGSLRVDAQNIGIGYLIIIRNEKEERELKKALALSYQQLELKVEQRTQELSQALNDLKRAQATLIESEKMAALGQLVAGVAHEINTPLGAINSSISNIDISTTELCTNLPALFSSTTPEIFSHYLKLLESIGGKQERLSSLEERKIRKEIAARLEAEAIPDSSDLAYKLVMMGAHRLVEELIPLLKEKSGGELISFGFNLLSLKRNSLNIQDAISRASKVLFALKNYAHFDPTSNRSLLEIDKEIENILVLYRHQIRQGVEVITEFAPTPPIWALHDELNQVWTNIIHNALYAMKNKGTLKIEIKPVDNSVSIKITDSGPGIPEEVMGKIFDPFFTTKPKGEGSGLGLNIAKKIVENHQGTLTVESAPGRTTFTAILPIGQQ
jgi:ABC-type transport system substrate-binding protein/signal transduction histidine kinase